MQATWDAYFALWTALPNEHEPSNQSFKDDTLMAFIIYVEFSSVPRDLPAFKEALEALSYQYRDPGYNFGTMCRGHCDSIQVELRWLDEMEGIRKKPTQDILDNWMKYRSFAQQAQAGYSGPVAARSHVWGNYYSGSPMAKYVAGEGPADWITTGAPYNAIYREARFIVMSGEQNLACKNRAGGSCVGF